MNDFHMTVKLMTLTCQCSSKRRGGIWQYNSVLLLPTSSMAGYCSGLTACTTIELHAPEPPLITAVQCNDKPPESRLMSRNTSCLCPSASCQEGGLFLLSFTSPSAKQRQGLALDSGSHQIPKHAFTFPQRRVSATGHN